jgi:prepilin-type N-terminal cleavage/methylation domain-containing protein
MKTNRAPDRNVPNRVRGFSLIEMMIALTLGLVVTAAVGYIFQASKRNLNYSQGMSRVQENMRSSLIILNTLVRQAGYLYNPLLYSSPGFNTPGLVFVNPAYPLRGGLASSTLSSTIVGANPTLTTGGEYLVVSFVGDTDTTTNVGTITNCLGSLIYQNQISVNVFYVDKKATDAVPSLYCATQTYVLANPPGNPPTAVTATPQIQPLIYGVSNLTISYGIGTSGAPRFTSYYDTYANVTASGSWGLVSSVSLKLITQSTNVAEGSAYAGGTCPSASNVSNAAGDTTLSCGYLQRPVTQTIAIRNLLQ